MWVVKGTTLKHIKYVYVFSANLMVGGVLFCFSDEKLAVT